VRSQTVVIAGALAQKPGFGGHTWVFLQYLLGLRRLGWDVVFVDRLEQETCVDAGGRPCPVEHSWNLRYLEDVMARFGLGESWSLLYEGGHRTFGLSRRELGERARDAVLLNVMGFLGDEEILGAAGRKVFLDIDPGFPQMWRELGLADSLQGHDAYVTIGANIGNAECSIPTCGIEWIKTVPPVVLEHWPVAEPRRSVFTSVVSWRGVNAPVQYKGRRYGLRVHEFRAFAALPGESGGEFELALDMHPGEHADRGLLDRTGWTLVDPRVVAADPLSYRDYIEGSFAELSVAKEMYVRSGSGWFSDRSICYLASGKPVLTQDTGLVHLGAGAGLLTFRTVDEAAAGVEEIRGDYRRHARSARELAETRFESDLVLRNLLAALGVA